MEATGAGAGLTRRQQRLLQVSAARLGVAILEAVGLLDVGVGGPLGLAALAWLVGSALTVGGAAVVRTRIRHDETGVAVIDVAVFVAVAATSPTGYAPVVALALLLLVQGPLRWGVTGALLTGTPVAVVAMVFPAVDTVDTTVTATDRISVLVVILAVLTLGLVLGRFLAHQRALHDQTQLTLALTFDHSPAATAIADVSGTLQQVNAAWVTLAGAPVATLVGRALVDLVEPADTPLLAPTLRLAAGATAEAEVRLSTRGGPHWVRVLAGCVPAVGGLPARVVVQLEDIAERRATAELLAHEASHDPLTGLPNRRLIDAALAELAGTIGGTGVLVIVDVDGFKQVNDRFGHQAGDDLLTVVAQRLRRAVRTGDLAARLAGDEFIVVGRDIADDAMARSVGTRVLDGLVGPAEVRAGLVDLRVSVGVRRIHADETDVRTVIRDADAALYRAKAAGGSGIEQSVRAGVAVASSAAGDQDVRALGNPELVAVIEPALREGDGPG